MHPIYALVYKEIYWPRGCVCVGKVGWKIRSIDSDNKMFQLKSTAFKMPTIHFPSFVRTFTHWSSNSSSAMWLLVVPLIFLTLTGTKKQLVEHHDGFQIWSLSKVSFRLYLARASSIFVFKLETKHYFRINNWSNLPWLPQAPPLLAWFTMYVRIPLRHVDLFALHWAHLIFNLYFIGWCCSWGRYACHVRSHCCRQKLRENPLYSASNLLLWRWHCRGHRIPNKHYPLDFTFTIHRVFPFPKSEYVPSGFPHPPL